jgi:hypothetical protein
VVERGRNHCGRAWLDGGPLVVPVRGGDLARPLQDRRMRRCR